MAKIERTHIQGLAGLLAFIESFLVLVVPFRDEPAMSLLDWSSPLGVIVVVLYLVTIGLYIWSLITRETKRRKYSETTFLVEERKKYLPQLRQAINLYINRVEYLAQNSKTLYDIKLLKDTYMSNAVYKPSVFVDHEDKLTMLALLYYNVFRDNILLRQITDNDDEALKLSRDIDSYYVNVKDTKIKKFAKGIREAVHIEYSFYIFSKIIADGFDKMPFVYRFYLRIKRKLQDRLRQHQNNLNTRIDALLEGADDE